MLPLIPLALGLAQAIPSIAGWFGGDDAEESAKQIVSIAKKVTGIDDAPDAVAAVKANPEYLLKVESMAHEWRVAYLKEQTERMKIVNETMRVEAHSEKWWVSSWRPFNGFMFGTTMFATYFLLPLMERDVPTIPEWVWMAWASVLGVTAWHRGQKQRGEHGGAVGNILDIFKKK